MYGLALAEEIGQLAALSLRRFKPLQRRCIRRGAVAQTHSGDASRQVHSEGRAQDGVYGECFPLKGIASEVSNFAELNASRIEVEERGGWSRALKEQTRRGCQTLGVEIDDGIPFDVASDGLRVVGH